MMVQLGGRMYENRDTTTLAKSFGKRQARCFCPCEFLENRPDQGVTPDISSHNPTPDRRLLHPQKRLGLYRV